MKRYTINSPIKYDGKVRKDGSVELPEGVAADLIALGHVSESTITASDAAALAELEAAARARAEAEAAEKERAQAQAAELAEQLRIQAKPAEKARIEAEAATKSKATTKAKKAK